MMAAEGNLLSLDLSVVRDVARRSGVGLEGVTVEIIEDPEYQRYLRYLGAVAITPAELRTVIQLMPEAFANEDTLAATLGHERNHVAQIALYGPPPDTVTVQAWEEASYLVESQYVAHLRGELQ
jgi:hypothetical protein